MVEVSRVGVEGDSDEDILGVCAREVFLSPHHFNHIKNNSNSKKGKQMHLSNMKKKVV